MNDQEAGQYWNNNAPAWITLARAGFDAYRDYLNTPGFFGTLPDITGLYGIDIGCGEGHNTRLLAKRGARLRGIDTSPNFIDSAKAWQVNDALSIDYQLAGAVALPFEESTFDFATSFMCLMDIPDPAKGILEAYRVLKPGGFLQFSITHPCFTTPHRKNLRDENGVTYAVEVGQYFNNLNGKVDEWIFNTTPNQMKDQFPKFKIPMFNFTLTQWFNMITAAGFVVEMVNEPYPNDDIITQQPAVQDAQVVAYFMHFRCRKGR